MISEFDREPIPGLPAEPPTGERIIWQGAPHWWSLARHALHVDMLAAYFGFLLAWRFVSGVRAHEISSHIARSEAILALLAMLTIAIVLVIARAMSRTTVYTITTARVVLRAGIALPVIVNLPHDCIQSADIRLRSNSTGDIVLKPSDVGGPGYAMLWPHARAWKLATPEPMIRSIKDCERIAGLLALQLNRQLVRVPEDRVSPKLLAAE